MIHTLWFYWISMSLFTICFGQQMQFQKKQPQVKALITLKNKLDILVKTDLKVLLPVLHDILNFYLDSKNDIDLNLEYGIFLLNVVMKRLTEEKSARLPKSIAYSLKHLLEKNDELMTFFKTQVSRDVNPDDKTLKKILTLYSNESVWMSQVKKFDIMHRKKQHIKVRTRLVSQYKNLSFYEELCQNSTPTPFQADFCMRFLAQVAINNTVVHTCKVPSPCVRLLYKGSSIGYALTHRLMMLQFARFGRRCYFVSEQKDRALEDRLCKDALQEAAFLSHNDYKFGDLMLEQITFCTLIGHFEFLKRSWLVQLVHFRTKDGCFADKLHHKERQKSKDAFTSEVPWLLNKESNAHLLSGWCEAQVTSGALTTMVLAVKYLLEAFY